MCKISNWTLIGIVCLCCFSIYAQNHIVKMKTNDTGIPMFQPKYLLIQPGDTVVWRNLDSDVSHNIVAESNGIPKGARLFESPLLETFNKEWSHQFSQAGTYHYHCHPHASKGMTGTVVVGRASLPAEFREESGNEHSHHHSHGQEH